jgi:uncharacterized damage-inducible protein DinB
VNMPKAKPKRQNSPRRNGGDGHRRSKSSGKTGEQVNGERAGSIDRRLAGTCVQFWQERLEKRFLPHLLACLEQLSEDEIWWRPNEASNSAGNLVLHLCGNMQQWIISGLGGAADVRERDKEFSERGPIAQGELRERLERTVKQSCEVLKRLSADDLTRRYRIQGFDVNGYYAAAQVTEHVSYHLGQIIYLTKMKRARDLGFTRLPTASSKPAERKL